MEDTQDDIYIEDDGTMDTVVCYRDQEFRFSSEYRFGFDNDKQFLEEIREEVEESYDYRKEQDKEDAAASKIASDLQTLDLLRKALNTHTTVEGFIVDRAYQIEQKKERKLMGLHPDICDSCAKIESLLTELLEEEN